MNLEEGVKRLREGHILEWVDYRRQKTNQRPMSYGRGEGILQNIPFPKEIREALMREGPASLGDSVSGQG